MKHLAAYLLVQLTNPHPTKENITALLATVGIEPNEERLDALFSMLEGKDVNELLEEGSKKLAVGFAASAGPGKPAATVTQGETSATETQEEEKKKEDSGEESDMDGFGGLFD